MVIWTNEIPTNLGPVQTTLHSCAEPNWIRFDFGATLARQLIQTAYCVSNLMWILNTDKAKGLGPMQFSRHYSAFKMVDMKERIAISRGYQRRKMFSESLRKYVALRRRRMILLLSLTGLLLFSRNQNITTDTVHLRSCRRLPRNNNRWWDMVWNTYTDERLKKTFIINAFGSAHGKSAVRISCCSSAE